MSVKKITRGSTCWHFCLLLLAAGLSVHSKSAAMTVTHQITVQPYQVVYSPGSGADITAVSDGSLELFSDAVFSQAGLDIDILNPIAFNSTPTGDIADHFQRFQIEAGLPPPTVRTIVPLFIDSWFPPPGSIGRGWVGAAGMLVQSPQSILSNFAHQLGHNLGLRHPDPFTGQTSNLMDYGSCLNATLVDVSPTISKCELDLDQINQIRNDLDNLSFVQNISAVPVPAAFWLFASALAGLVGFSKRRKSS